MYKSIVISMLIIFLSQMSFAQQHWTLEDCINYAMENNLQVKKQELNTEIYENNLLTSKISLLPSVNGGINQNFTFGRSIDPFTNEFSSDNVSSSNVSVSSSLTIFNGLKQYNSIKKNEFDLKASLMDLETIKNNISLNIVSAFLNILYARESVEITKEQTEITQQQLERTKILVEAGSLSMQSQLEMEAQLANEELSLVSAENQLAMANLVLIQLLELKEVIGFDIIAPEIKNIISEPIMIPVSEIYSQALESMPEIESAEWRLKSSEKSLAIAKGGRSPILAVSASYGTGYSDARKDIDNITPTGAILSGYATDDFGNYFDVYQYNFDYSYVTRPFNDQIRDNASTSVSFGLNIPIFNGWSVNSNIKFAKIQVQQSRIDFEQTQNQLLQEIQQAYADAEAAVKKYDASKKALQAMEISFEYTQNKFDLGLVTSVDFNTTKNNLIKTESELLRAKYDLIFKQKILDFYRGVEIRL
jgi:outer membrane protein